MTFAAPARSIFGFLGPNGAGKTPIRMLGTILEPTKGRASIVWLAEPTPRLSQV